MWVVTLLISAIGRLLQLFPAIVCTHVQEVGNVPAYIQQSRHWLRSMHLTLAVRGVESRSPPPPVHVTCKRCIPGKITLIWSECSRVLCIWDNSLFSVVLCVIRRSGDQIPVEARFSAPVKTGLGAHPVSSTMGTGSFPGVKRPGRGVDHPPHLAPRLKKE